MDNVAARSNVIRQNVPKGYIDKHLYALRHPASSQFAET